MWKRYKAHPKKYITSTLEVLFAHIYDKRGVEINQ